MKYTYTYSIKRMLSDMTALKFVPYSSAFDTGFWHELTRRKLDIYRLDSSNQSIYGYYSNGE